VRFDKAIAEQFVTALRAALADDDAAVHAGVELEQIERWREARRSFDDDVRRAKADVALLNAGRVRQAAREDWRAALALADRAEQQRELERLRRLTTDDARA
jgi:hypothetical protein